MSFKKKGGAPRPEPVPLPDLGALWKSYSGWMSNINRRNEGQLADVRARLSAAGATPELIKMQSEHLESQRSKEIAEIQGGATYRQLQEGYGIAMGGANPYAGDPLGSEQFRERVEITQKPGIVTKYGTGEDATASWQEEGMIDERKVTPGRAPVGFEQYFSEFYGAPDAGENASAAGDAAKQRAKTAAGGAAPTVAPGAAGSSSGAAANPWVDESQLMKLFG